MRLSIGKCWGLLIFDLFGLAIAGYGYLLGYQILQTLPHADAFIILMGLFVGIKLVVLSLYDLNRSPFLKNMPFIGGLVATIGNGIIFGLCLFLIPEVPFYFFMGLALVDFVMVTLAHLLWWVLIGKDGLLKEEAEVIEKPVKKTARPKKTESRKNWLSSTDDEEADYDSIFNSLIENNSRSSSRSESRRQEVMQPTFKESKQIDYLEAEKRYETGEFLRDIKRNLGKEEQSPFAIEEELNQSRFDQVQFEKPAFQEQKTTVLPQAKIQSELAQKAPKEIVESIWEMPKEKEHTATKPVIPSVTTREIPKMSVERELGSAVFEPVVKEPKAQKDASRIKNGLDFNGDEQGDFSSIEKRLSSLFNEIEQSMEETHYLQNAVTVFQQEIESYQPITGDEKIVAAG
ncbi:MAG: hypothetical protein AB7D16_09390, partial [Eubacteriaceae bacterium]